MERLVFFWKEKKGRSSFDYGEGISLSGKYLIKKKNYRLDIHQNPRFINDFWGDTILDIQALVGENGAGKTTVVKDIIECITASDDSSHDSFVIGIESMNGKIDIYYNNNVLSDSFIDENVKYIDLDVCSNVLPLCNDSYIGYLSNQLSAGDYFVRLAVSDNYMDASLGGRIRQYHDNAIAMHYVDYYTAELAYYFWKDNFKILKSIVEIANSSETDLRIDNREIQEIVTTIVVKEAFTDYANARISEVLGTASETLRTIYRRTTRFKEVVAFHILQNAVLELCEPKMVPQNNEEQRQAMFDYIQYELRPQLVAVGTDIFELEKEAIYKITNFFKYKNPKYQDAVEILSKMSFSKNYELQKTFVLDVEKHNSDLKKLVSIYEKTYSEQPYLQIDFGVSAGEFCLLKLISDLYELKEKSADKKYKNIVLFLDEPDNGLHFRWQRMLAVWMKDICDSIFKDKKVQIVMTTHSPLLLSDIPDYNVTYVDTMSIKEVTKKTFANNINGLFLDSFFLDSDGVIGEYAKTKVNELADELEQKGSYVDNSASKLFDLIGDEYLLNGLSHISRADIGFQRNSNDDNKEEMLSLLRDQERKIQELIRIVERR